MTSLHFQLATNYNWYYSILRSLKSQSLMNDDTNLTIREGRMVIPLAVEYKRRIKGSIHDTSAIGQTVFIEP